MLPMAFKLLKMISNLSKNSHNVGLESNLIWCSSVSICSRFVGVFKRYRQSIRDYYLNRLALSASIVRKALRLKHIRNSARSLAIFEFSLCYKIIELPFSE